jgi:hypothetical protein
MKKAWGCLHIIPENKQKKDQETQGGGKDG